MLNSRYDLVLEKLQMIDDEIKTPVISNEYGLIELGKVLGEYRQEQYVNRKSLCRGVCTLNELRDMERGKCSLNEMQLERIASRLHLQPRFFDYSLTETQFLLREQRNKIDRFITLGKTELAHKELSIFEEMLQERTPLTEQYILWQQTRCLEQQAKTLAITQDEICQWGWNYQSALEKTLLMGEAEKELEARGLLSIEEVSMYLSYRRLLKPLASKERKHLFEFVERNFVDRDFITDDYTNLGMDYVRELLQKKEVQAAYQICFWVLKKLEKHRHFNGQPELNCLLAETLQYYPTDMLERDKIKHYYYKAYALYLSMGRTKDAADVMEKMGECCNGVL